jgi:non-specific serine/threonine protein kinase
MIKERSLEGEEVRQIGIQCCQALHAAHEEGVIHRDIKASNIMINKNGQAKILDFGLAKVIVDASATESSAIMGTYQYMSPEQIQGKPLDRRSDLFSLGVVLYEALAGRLPFFGDTIAATIYAIVHEDAPPVSSYRADAPTDMEQVIARALSKDVESRYQSAADMESDLSGSTTVTPVTVRHEPITTPVIAVMPFRALSRDAEADYLAEGICEDVVTAIVKLPGLAAASRSAIKRLLKRNLDPSEIGRELNAAYLLEGSLRRIQDTVRLNLQLVRTGDEATIWSDSYDRKISDIFTLQADIAAQVASALNISVSGITPTQDEFVREVNPHAYELYLEGKFFLKKRDQSSVIKAADLFLKAIELDPDFGAAYSELAVACNLCEEYGYEHQPNVIARGGEFAERGVDLEPGSSQAHMALFFDLRFTNISRAVTELRTATALDPSNSEAYHFLAHTEMLRGHYRSAERAALTANGLDPFMENCDANLCRLYYLTGQQAKYSRQLKVLSSKYGQSYVVSSTNGWLAWCERDWSAAADEYQRALSIEPIDPVLTDRLADCYLRMQKPGSAVDILERTLESKSSSAMLRARLGQILLSIGEVNRADENFKAAAAHYAQTYSRRGASDSMFHQFQMALVACLRGDRRAAMTRLMAAIDKGYGHWAELRVRPDWDLLHGSDDFESLVNDLQNRRQPEDRA